MRTNLFPAILLAGSPNCGKSVLSYLLTQELRKRQVQHYLLRTAPDGEGDWFLEGNSEAVRILRMENKGHYSDELIDHMRQAIHTRRLPLLVDIGGKPRNNQFEILGACTHYVLLYKTDEEHASWQAEMTRLELLPIAELRSSLHEQEWVAQTSHGLEGVIGGLERNQPQTGPTFQALLAQVEGICQYDMLQLEQEHTRDAPHALMIERVLASHVQRNPQPNPWWEPSELPKILEVVPPAQAVALYGRGPVWLAAALAVHAFPAAFAVFDARYAWLPVPVCTEGETEFLNVQIQPDQTQPFDWLKVKITNLILTPQKTLALPDFTGERGVVMSGRLPRWLFAALARKLLAERPWMAIHVPALNKAVVIYRQGNERAVGECLML
ncbi:MAG: CRISPR-associated protein Csx3 [Anaerolineales bacterium]